MKRSSFFSHTFSAALFAFALDFVSATSVQAAAASRKPQTSPVPGNGDIYDIYGPVPLTEPLLWPYFLAAALVILALLLFWFFSWKKRKKRTTEKPFSAHREALAALDQARSHKEQGQSLLFAEKVSALLRTYIEKRFAIRTTRQTTSEFFQALDFLPENKNELLFSFREQLQLCLEQCDLAKYAHRTAQQDGMEKLDQSVRRFITETAPPEEG